jgi:hypothetical protein
MKAARVVNYLLELNVLNLQHIERELRNVAARAIYPQVRKWLMTVARNYIINLSDEEMESEYEVYTPKRPKKGIHTDMPEPEKLPGWAQKAIGGDQPLHFFNPAQPRRRELWQAVENIVDWFNTFPNDDRLNRLDRVSFQQAREQATKWREAIDANPWQHIKDRPTVYKTYDDGMKWVKMGSELHLKREGKLMGHCVGNGGYTQNMRRGTAEYFSLRDANNSPHITVEAYVRDGQYQVMQMKGKENKKPVARYQPYLRDLVTQPGWQIVGDTSHVDL